VKGECGMITSALLLKGLAAAIIVGFVTSSIRSWIDRVFLVIMLVGIVGLPIKQAIEINILVVGLAALFHVLRQKHAFRNHVPAGSDEWFIISISAALGGILGRLAGNDASPKLLLGLLGVYAMLTGLRILIIKPLPEREEKAHPALLAPVGLAGGFFTGLLSAGAKPFIVPAYNNAMGHHPQRAYFLASVGVVAGAWASIATQFIAFQSPDSTTVLLALYEFSLVTIVALIVNRFWTEKLAKIVNLTIAPILIAVGIKFLLSAIR